MPNAVQVIIKPVPPEVVWPLRHQVMYPEKEFDTIKLPEDSAGIHLALHLDGQVVSVVSLFLQGKDLQFRKFATLDTQQGKGYGTRLLQYVLHYARQQGATRIWCNARQSAAAFYKKFGLEETAEKFTKGGITYVVMERIEPFIG